MRRKAKNAPITTIRIGKIKADIWENDTKDGEVWYNAKFSRIYKNDENK